MTKTSGETIKYQALTLTAPGSFDAFSTCEDDKRKRWDAGLIYAFQFEDMSKGKLH